MLRDRIVNRTSLVIIVAIVLCAALLSRGGGPYYDLSSGDVKWEVAYNPSSGVEPDNKTLTDPWLKNAPGESVIVVEQDPSSRSDWWLNISTPVDTVDGAVMHKWTGLAKNQ